MSLAESGVSTTGLRMILASASPRRRELLAQAGFTFTIDAADVDESTRAGEAADAYVERLAVAKAQTVFARHSTVLHPTHRGEQGALIVLGADTSVVLGDEILGKPTDADDARRMLQRLFGRTHSVLTGMAVVTRAGVVSAVESTEVVFANISDAELDAYCATAEPLDKAGAYGIQGYAARWIPRIDGCYFNVMGLPIARVVRLIDEALTGCR